MMLSRQDILVLRGNEMATKNRIAYALPIIQIMKILSAKSHKQMCLRLVYRERVGIISLVIVQHPLSCNV